MRLSSSRDKVLYKVCQRCLCSVPPVWLMISDSTIGHLISTFSEYSYAREPTYDHVSTKLHLGCAVHLQPWFPLPSFGQTSYATKLNEKQIYADKDQRSCMDANEACCKIWLGDYELSTKVWDVVLQVHPAHLCQAEAAIIFWVLFMHCFCDCLPSGLQPLTPRTPGSIEIDYSCKEG